MPDDPNTSGATPGKEPHSGKLVDANRLLEILWDEKSRPSLRWLRDRQAERAIPYVKVGALVWFDPEDVRRCLKERWTVGKIRK
jgi:hypothetical protein